MMTAVYTIYVFVRFRTFFALKHFRTNSFIRLDIYMVLQYHTLGKDPAINKILFGRFRQKKRLRFAGKTEYLSNYIYR